MPEIRSAQRWRAWGRSPTRWSALRRDMANLSELQKKALQFANLHQGPRILILANAWDAASARIFEAAGCPAIATSSAGVAFALGHRDGEQLTRDEMLEVVRRVVDSVSIPVS